MTEVRPPPVPDGAHFRRVDLDRLLVHAGGEERDPVARGSDLDRARRARPQILGVDPHHRSAQAHDPVSDELRRELVRAPGDDEDHDSALGSAEPERSVVVAVAARLGPLAPLGAVRAGALSLGAQRRSAQADATEVEATEEALR